MKADHDNFGPLRRLLKLKRYEQPAPRYFDDFSRQIIRRIQAGEGVSTSFWERFFNQDTWIQRMWETMGAKPALVGVLGVAACGLLIAGVLVSGGNDAVPPAFSPMAQGMNTVFTPLPASATTVAFKPASEQPALVSSSNSMVAPQPAGSLFDQFKLEAQPASFPVNGN